MQQPDVLVFRFPMPENIANTPMHHMVRQKLKTAYWAHCDALQAGAVLPPPPKTPWPQAVIASRMVVGNPMDDGNAMNRHKWVEDWLRTRGYIADDRKKCLRWDGLPVQHISRKNTPEIEITLTKAEA
jgi:hypothetical protein